MSKILKNTLIAELIWLAGAATQTIAPGGKHSRAATELTVNSWKVIVVKLLFE